MSIFTYKINRQKTFGDNAVIRILRENDLTTVMQIWLNTNINAHNFIPKKYWTDNYDAVKDLLLQAEIYVYENDESHEIMGFMGLTNNYIGGIFVKEEFQSKGIGKQLLNYAKKIKQFLSLNVYQKNVRALSFYQREKFIIQSESIDDYTNEKEFIMSWSK